MVIHVTSPGRRISDWNDDDNGDPAAAGTEILNQYNLNTEFRKWFMSLHKTEQLIFKLVMWTMVEGTTKHIYNVYIIMEVIYDNQKKQDPFKQTGLNFSYSSWEWNTI